MQRYFRFIHFLLLFAIPLSSAGAIAPFPVGPNATADKPQSKAWYHDGSWWLILFDGEEGSYFYKLVEGAWQKGAFPDALVYPKAYTRADVLSSGDTLFVLEWEALRQIFLAILGVKDPKPANCFPAVDDKTYFASKVAWDWFEAMDPGPTKEIDGRLFWIAGL